MSNTKKYSSQITESIQPAVHAQNRQNSSRNDAERFSKKKNKIRARTCLLLQKTKKTAS